ncbi:MAG: hypothetical protein I8H75_06430 [Myxococcaceae bacterium]|nr:hypothetical protein [Myxococcaceae bacterium]MBH2006952.1 hypothetical protein [Myxococcaceae bacterium]
MKKYLYSLVIGLVCAPAIVEAFEVPNEVLDLAALPHCAPTRFSDEDIAEKSIAPRDRSGDRLGALEHLQRYYLSQLIDLKESEEPPYASIAHSSWQEAELKAFSTKMMQIATENDVCDAITILYVARFQKYFCPGSPAHQSLHPEAKKNVDALLRWPGNALKLAKRVSKCSFL